MPVIKVIETMVLFKLILLFVVFVGAEKSSMSLENIKEMDIKIKKYLLSSLLQIIDKTTKEYNNLNDNCKETFVAVEKRCSVCTPTESRTEQSWLDKMFDPLQVLEDIGSSLLKEIQNINNGVGDNVEDLKEVTFGTTKSVLDSILQNAKEISNIDRLSNLFKETLDALTNLAKELQTISEKLSSTTNSILDSFKDDTFNLGDSLLNSVTELENSKSIGLGGILESVLGKRRFSHNVHSSRKVYFFKRAKICPGCDLIDETKYSSDQIIDHVCGMGTAENLANVVNQLVKLNTYITPISNPNLAVILQVRYEDAENKNEYTGVELTYSLGSATETFTPSAPLYENDFDKTAKEWAVEILQHHFSL